MSRPKLVKAIDRYLQRYPEEQALGQEFKQFVLAHEDCFSRSLQIGHVTGSAWIIDSPHKHCLLTHHKKLDRWLQLGGHADGDGNTARVATREALEESGLKSLQLVSLEIFDLDIHTIPERGDEPEHQHFDVRYLFETNRDAPLVVSDEANDLAWIALDDIEALTSERSILRMVEKTG